MEHDALTLVFTRNAFYRRLYYLTFGAFVLTFLSIIILAWIFIYLLKNPIEPLYFATDHVGRLVQVVPVNRPNMTRDEVAAWAIEAVQTAYSYDYINYRSQLQQSQKYFTRYGWTRYMDALTASNNLLALSQRKMVVVATVVDQPKILTEGILGGAYAWRFQMPILVTYLLPPYDDNSKFSNPLTITMIIQRQEELKSYKGLGIVQIIGAMAAAPSQPRELVSPTAPSQPAS